MQCSSTRGERGPCRDHVVDEHHPAPADSGRVIRSHAEDISDVGCSGATAESVLGARIGGSLNGRVDRHSKPPTNLARKECGLVEPTLAQALSVNRDGHEEIAAYCHVAPTPRHELGQWA
jgi:hypothetical protein